jgi:alpha-N-arabinofuranosidase
MLTQLEQPSLIAQRITEFSFEAFIEVDFNTSHDNEEAGFAAIYNNKRNFRLVKSINDGQPVVNLYKTEVGDESLVATEQVVGRKLVLGLIANELEYQFYYGSDKNNLKKIGEIQDAKVNASQSGIDFTGPLIGMYASSNGSASENIATFNWFEYKPVPTKY